MSIAYRRLLLSLIGLFAGLAAWSLAEIIVSYQAAFSSFLIFSVVSGGIFGLLFGIFFGSAEGIINSVKKKIIRGIITGSLVGLLGGALGFLTAQAVLFILGEYFLQSQFSFNVFGLPISRALGWGVLGIFIGLSEGIRAFDPRKIKIGILGGLIGGFLGGLLLEYMRIFIPDMAVARLAGFSLFGLVLGFSYSIVESSLSYGILRVLNGRLKGKEFYINQRKMLLGTSIDTDIKLTDYKNVQEIHAQIKIQKKDAVLKTLHDNQPLIINEEKTLSQRLKLNDVIQIGDVKLLYKF
ncbi:MAG: hypothetical protein A2Y41_02410 [Spirochaetes bacterium GWB1_36_13]|nr:MAG: hypothetical protein A2Y41_02410 [Spirochaetes bacterium GWB1_36_13]